MSTRKERKEALKLREHFRRGEFLVMLHPIIPYMLSNMTDITTPEDGDVTVLRSSYLGWELEGRYLYGNLALPMELRYDGVLMAQALEKSRWYVGRYYNPNTDCDLVLLH